MVSSRAWSLRRPPRGMQRRRPTVYGMPRILEDRLDRAFLDESARVEDADARAHLRDHAQVVADEEHRRVELRLELRHEVEHLRLDGRVEPGRRLVEDEERRVLRERHRDHDPLLHPARELVRIAPEHRVGIGDLHAGERFAGALARLASARSEHRERLRDLSSDPDRRVQGAPRVLVDHRDPARVELAQGATVKRERVLSRDRDRTAGDGAVPRQVADDRERRGRFPAARLADEAVRLAGSDAERDPSQDRPVLAADAVGDVQVAELEHLSRRRLDAHRSSTCWTLSETRLTATTSEAIAIAGKSTVHHCSDRYG